MAHRWWILALAATACSDRKPAKRVAPRDAAIPDALAPVYTEADATAAKYHSFDDILADRAHARGKLAVVRASREAIRESDITAYPCPSHGGDKLFMTIPPGARDLVRAMPTSSTGDCPRVLVKVLSVGSAGFSGYRAADGSWQTREDAQQIVETDILAIFDVAPRPPTPPPAGIAFVTYDDIRLAPFKGGELAQLALRRNESDPITGTLMVPCDGNGAVNFPDEGAERPLHELDGCHVVRFRTRPPASPDWGWSIDADLIAIGSTVR